LIHSMTAFGRSQKEDSRYRITMELRTLNGRNLDVVLRLPKNYLEFEEPLRKQIVGQLKRGRVEAFIQIESILVERKAARINQTLARHYWEQLRILQEELPGAPPPELDCLLRFPDIFETVESDDDRSMLEELLTATLNEALLQLNKMRTEEGDALFQDLSPRLTLLQQEITRIEHCKGKVLEDYHQRLQERVQELLGGVQVDGDRLLQEIALFAERSDITEEIVRTRSHLEQMQGLLTGSEPAVGRELDFLSQELHREINTIGSKANDLEIAQAVVRMKCENAKLREQIQNIE
jgi:uncharacterized protein (TIGR00255 family)